MRFIRLKLLPDSSLRSEGTVPIPWCDMIWYDAIRNPDESGAFPILLQTLRQSSRPWPRSGPSEALPSCRLLEPTPETQKRKSRLTTTIPTQRSNKTAYTTHHLLYTLLKSITKSKCHPGRRPAQHYKRSKCGKFAWDKWSQQSQHNLKRSFLSSHTSTVFGAWPHRAMSVSVGFVLRSPRQMNQYESLKLYTFMIPLWYLYDTFMIPLWYLYDTFMIPLWYLYDTFMIPLCLVFAFCPQRKEELHKLSQS